jgi:hypothetical protein
MRFAVHNSIPPLRNGNPIENLSDKWSVALGEYKAAGVRQKDIRMGDDQPRKFLRTYQKTKIDTAGWASQGGPSQKVIFGEPGVWRDRQKEEEALRKEDESVATKLQNEARLLANVEMLQQELIERQQVIIGYQQSTNLTYFFAL